MTRPPAWLAALALCASATAYAQTPALAATDLDSIEVTATVLPAAAAGASHNITVLGPEQLRAWRGRSLAEVLAQAGVVVDRSAGGGGYGALYLRGADPSHVVVLVDGVRQNDPLSSRGSAVDLNSLPLERIERIEIVRGSASVAQAGAMAGAIHLHTRRTGSGASAGIAVGGGGLRALRAGLSGEGWSLALGQREEGGSYRGFHQARAVDAAWERQLLPTLGLRMAFGYGDSEGRGFPDDSGGPRHAVLRALDVREANTRQFSVQGFYRPAAGALELQWNRFARDGVEGSPGVAPGLRDPVGLPAMAADTGYRRDELQATWRQRLGADGELGAGVLQQQERGRYGGLIDYGFVQWPVGFSMRRDTSAAFAELRWQPGAWTAQAGLRHERRRDAGADAGSTTQPMLSLQRRAGVDGAHWGASVSRSSKAPSFYALGHPLVGNPALRPERGQLWEMYYDTGAAVAWPGRITLFGARYRDLVDFDDGPPPQLVNRARIATRGLEWRTARRFDNGWRLAVDGTWLQVRDQHGDDRLRHRPRLQAGASLVMPLDTRHELSLGLHHLGRRFDSAIPTGARWLDEATTLDLALRRLWGRSSMLLALDDAANARGEEIIGLDMPGRRLRLSWEWAL